MTGSLFFQPVTALEALTARVAVLKIDIAVAELSFQRTCGRPVKSKSKVADLAEATPGTQESQDLEAMYEKLGALEVELWAVKKKLCGDSVTPSPTPRRKVPEQSLKPEVQKETPVSGPSSIPLASCGSDPEDMALTPSPPPASESAPAPAPSASAPSASTSSASAPRTSELPDDDDSNDSDWDIGDTHDESTEEEEEAESNKNNSEDEELEEGELPDSEDDNCEEGDGEVEIEGEGDIEDDDAGKGGLEESGEDEETAVLPGGSRWVRDPGPSKQDALRTFTNKVYALMRAIYGQPLISAKPQSQNGPALSLPPPFKVLNPSGGPQNGPVVSLPPISQILRSLGPPWCNAVRQKEVERDTPSHKKNPWGPELATSSCPVLPSTEVDAADEVAKDGPREEDVGKLQDAPEPRLTKQMKRDPTRESLRELKVEKKQKLANKRKREEQDDAVVRKQARTGDRSPGLPPPDEDEDAQDLRLARQIQEEEDARFAQHLSDNPSPPHEGHAPAWAPPGEERVGSSSVTRLSPDKSLAILRWASGLLHPDPAINPSTDTSFPDSDQNEGITAEEAQLAKERQEKAIEDEDNAAREARLARQRQEEADEAFARSLQAQFDSGLDTGVSSGGNDSRSWGAGAFNAVPRIWYVRANAPPPSSRARSSPELVTPTSPRSSPSSPPSSPSRSPSSGKRRCREDAEQPSPCGEKRPRLDPEDDNVQDIKPPVDSSSMSPHSFGNPEPHSDPFTPKLLPSAFSPHPQQLPEARTSPRAENTDQKAKASDPSPPAQRDHNTQSTQWSSDEAPKHPSAHPTVPHVKHPDEVWKKPSDSPRGERDPGQSAANPQAQFGLPHDDLVPWRHWPMAPYKPLDAMRNPEALDASLLSRREKRQLAGAERRFAPNTGHSQAPQQPPKVSAETSRMHARYRNLPLTEAVNVATDLDLDDESQLTATEKTFLKACNEITIAGTNCATPWRHTTLDEERRRLMFNADKRLLTAGERAFFGGYYAYWVKVNGVEPQPQCVTPWRHMPDWDGFGAMLTCADPESLSKREQRFMDAWNDMRGPRPRGWNRWLPPSSSTMQSPPEDDSASSSASSPGDPDSSSHTAGRTPGPDNQPAALQLPEIVVQSPTPPISSFSPRTPPPKLDPTRLTPPPRFRYGLDGYTPTPPLTPRLTTRELDDFDDFELDDDTPAPFTPRIQYKEPVAPEDDDKVGKTLPVPPVPPIDMDRMRESLCIVSRVRSRPKPRPRQEDLDEAGKVFLQRARRCENKTPWTPCVATHDAPRRLQSGTQRRNGFYHRSSTHLLRTSLNMANILAGKASDDSKRTSRANESAVTNDPVFSSNTVKENHHLRASMARSQIMHQQRRGAWLGILPPPAKIPKRVKDALTIINHRREKRRIRRQKRLAKAKQAGGSGTDGSTDRQGDDPLLVGGRYVEIIHHTPPRDWDDGFMLKRVIFPIEEADKESSGSPSADDRSDAVDADSPDDPNPAPVDDTSGPRNQGRENVDVKSPDGPKLIP